MSLFELYVGSEKEAESYRARLRTIRDDVEKNAVVKVVREAESELRLPAIRTSYNIYEGELSVAKLLTHLASR
ncbi:MAG: hypothetical protein QOH71_3575 [Blastocatellia bacterium]|jgi:hypothetical protein|nr:hypothetical protein [Blastocatellia bacterium]